VRKLHARDIRETVDVVCGGFPCQPFSSAARGRVLGKADDRFLWPEMLRLVSECKPSWVIGENVTSIDSLALEQVVSDLEGIGYETRPLEIPACAVGHDHKRSRYWILGYSDGYGKPSMQVHAEASRLPWNRSKPGIMGNTYGVSSRMDRLRALGNAVVPQIPEIIGRAILNATS
jgi:DNA (cytosine-5)-methyltransferase 1